MSDLAFTKIPKTNIDIIFSADRTLVILVAQVFNGCLLPFLSSLLLICINDPQFMGSRPQPVWANVLMVVSVMITMFLASNVIIQKMFVSLLTCPACVNIRLGAAAGAALLEMAALMAFTSLGPDLVRSWRLES